MQMHYISSPSFYNADITSAKKYWCTEIRTCDTLSSAALGKDVYSPISAYSFIWCLLLIVPTLTGEDITSRYFFAKRYVAIV